MDSEIFLDVNLTHYPLRDYKNIWSDLNTIVKKYGKITQDCFSLKDLAVNGKDLMQLGFPQGKSIGNALSTLLELVMDDKMENDKEKLLTKARQLIDG